MTEIDKFSGLKVLYHPDHVAAALDGKPMYPVHINIDPTNYCNHRCIWCSGYEGQQSDANDLDFETIVQALTAARARGLKAVTMIGSGDPSLYKRFIPLTKKIHDLGLDLGMFTHGMFARDRCSHIVDNFTWVRFSLDAGSTETHNRVHGVKNKYSKILDNIAELVRLRESADEFTVGVQFVMHQTNLGDLQAAAAKVKALGADYFTIKPVIKRGAVEIRTEKFNIDWAEVMREVEETRALADDNFEVLFKPYQFQINNVPYAHDTLGASDFKRNYTRCYATNFEWWIRNNLDVDVCGPMHKTVGNLRTQSFESILNSDAYRQVTGAIDISQCYRGCRPHYLNETMHSLQDPELRKAAVAELAGADFKTHQNFVG